MVRVLCPPHVGERFYVRCMAVWPGGEGSMKQRVMTVGEGESRSVWDAGGVGCASAKRDSRFWPTRPWPRRRKGLDQERHGKVCVIR